MEQNQTTSINEKLAQSMSMQYNADQIQDKKEAAHFIDFKMITFTLAGKDYGIDIMHIKEIAKAGRFTYVPNTEPFVLGVYNLRGEIIPILDLRIFFNVMQESEKSIKKMQNLLILNVEDQIFGLVVDKIDKVIGVQKSTIQPPHPLFGDINIKYISGVVENNSRLYVLLDVMRIFSIHETENADFDKFSNVKAPVTPLKINSQPVSNEQKVEEQTPVAAQPPAPDNSAIDLKFIKESLAQYIKFHVSDINEKWIGKRYDEWKKIRGSQSLQLQTEKDADDFIQGFWSVHNCEWWSRQYADSIKAVLPDNAARQIVVWNPGCAKGIETYSLACVLKERYPGVIIRIYAQDIDLLNVSNASLMTVPASLADDWYAPYLTKTANNEYTFSNEIKECIMFEYHDCKNANILPSSDIIFARDVLSVCDEASQKAIISDFQEKLKGNGIIIIGDNEYLGPAYGFNEKSVGAVVAYIKD
ncbi:MAG: chemotaxis protein CheW [Treponema sp.]|nr:chemotaxis protein CheW [Treponema sp.]